MTEKLFHFPSRHSTIFLHVLNYIFSSFVFTYLRSIIVITHERILISSHYFSLICTSFVRLQDKYADSFLNNENLFSIYELLTNHNPEYSLVNCYYFLLREINCVLSEHILQELFTLQKYKADNYVCIKNSRTTQVC